MDVYVQEGGQLRQASADLAGAVTTDLTLTRERVLTSFGSRKPPGVDVGFVGDFFARRGWNIPASTVINPDTDAGALLRIFRSAKFPHPANEEFFAGANGSYISPGASPELDLVIFQDWRQKYRDRVTGLLARWGATATESAVDFAVAQHELDSTVHEFTHLAGGLACSAVVLERTGRRSYRFADRATAGFLRIEDAVPSPQLGDAGYYSGPALDESFPAFVASEAVLAFQGSGPRDSFPLSKTRYQTRTHFVTRKGQEVFRGVGGLHSGQTGVAMELIDAAHPGTLAAMHSVADGRLPLAGFHAGLRERVGEDTRQLLLAPDSRAWDALLERYAPAEQ
jgi:hypothetical protein